MFTEAIWLGLRISAHGNEENDSHYKYSLSLIFYCEIVKFIPGAVLCKKKKKKKPIILDGLDSIHSQFNLISWIVYFIDIGLQVWVFKT